MPILKAGAASTTFDLDGKEYSKGLYEATYSDVITLADGSSDESKLTIGLRNINTGDTIQESVMIRAWKNGSQTPYTTLDSLVADLNSVAGMGSSGVAVSGYNIKRLLPSIGITYLQTGAQAYAYESPTAMDYSGYGVEHPRIIQLPGGQGWTITSFLNFDKAVELEDMGTAQALQLSGLTIDAAVIDDLLTQLPATTKTATINLIGTSGAATCNPSIATAKGYTVLTA